MGLCAKSRRHQFNNSTVQQWHRGQNSCHAGRSTARVVGNLCGRQENGQDVNHLVQWTAVAYCNREARSYHCGGLRGPSPNHAFQIHQCLVRVVRLESNSLQLRPCCNLRNLFCFPAFSAFLLRHAAEPGYCQAVVSDASSRWHPVGLCQSIQFFNKIYMYIYIYMYAYIYNYIYICLYIYI